MSIPARSTLGRIINVVTESKDALDALFEALPDHCRRGVGTQPHRRAEALWRCWDELDFELALWKLGVEQLEDWVFGQVGQALAEASRRAGRPVGFQVGPWDRPPAPRLTERQTLEDFVLELASYFRERTPGVYRGG